MPITAPRGPQLPDLVDRPYPPGENACGCCAADPEGAPDHKKRWSTPRKTGQLTFRAAQCE
jgi:hypothetical protein